MEKKYALKLGEDGRILYATYPQFAPHDAVLVGELPEGDVADYLYDPDSGYIYDPLPADPVEGPAEPTSLEARVGDLEEALGLLLSGVTE